MARTLKSGVVSLNGEAKKSCLEMMRKIDTNDSRLKIDHSKLVSYIIIDYSDKYFAKNLKKIVSFHTDSRQEIKSKLNKFSNEELELLSKYISKLKPEDRHE